MEQGFQQGRPEEELFMRPGSDRPRTPTIQPLRINKSAASPSPSLNNATNYGFPQVANPWAQENPAAQSPPRRAPYPEDPSFERTERVGRPYPMTPPPAVQRPYGAAPTNPYYAPPNAASSSQSPGLSRVQPPQTSQPVYPAPNAGSSAFPRYPQNADHQPAIRILRPGERNPMPHKPLPDSPGPDLPDKEGLYDNGQQRFGSTHQVFHARDELEEGTGTIEPQSAATEFARQYYGQPPAAETVGQSSGTNLATPTPQGVNRLTSSASVNTTKASRGSPPPPETPEGTYMGGNVYPNYPVPSTSSPRPQNGQPVGFASSQAPQQQPQAQGSNSYGSIPTNQQVPLDQAQQRPSQTLASQGAPNTAYQLNAAPNNTRPVTPPRQTTLQYEQQPHNYPGSPIENEMSRLRLGGEEPPPSYASVTPHSTQGYASEKPGGQQQMAAQHDPNLQNHPAFANEASQRPHQIASPIPSQPNTLATSATPHPQQTPSPALSQQSLPPPLPEGWIAHLDSNTGCYYYIHLPTQATQWEFPKGPTPQSLNEPLSPTGTYLGSNVATPTASTFNFNKPIASPGFAPQDPYRQSMLSMSSMSSPTAAGFTQQPPTSGVEQYRIAPTNGVYFGPYLRYTNMDVDNGYWFGSIMLVTDIPHPPTIHIHQSTDLSPNRKLPILEKVT